MSSVNSLIISTLEPLNIDIELLRYTGIATTYIIFVEYLEQGEGYSQDDEELTGHYIQMNLFSKTNNIALIKQIKDLLKAQGFKRKGEYDTYDSTTFYYCHTFRFLYLETV